MTTIPATARLLEGYVGPLSTYSGDIHDIAAWNEEVGASMMFFAVSDGVECDYLSEKNATLDLTHPIAFSHVLRLVAESVGLDARGGVTLRLYSVGRGFAVWVVECGGQMRYFTSGEPETASERHVPNLPASPDAYPEALAAIAAVVLS